MYDHLAQNLMALPDCSVQVIDGARWGRADRSMRNSRQTVEKRGLAHIRKPYDTTLKCHILILSLLVFKFRLQSYKNF